ncbi:hypothetical protein FUAX_39430 (plasmid) [Fulvitalea axinellae]|uniref:Fibronectin type-III domain-containing protein n=1 Tax=Fulvitalea axinellae TaxID=1182444 RepID=A0AAU9CH63_9BACT|nr:hypothetical protein FUAX_39430 [Fulvitalea axinellae]
MKRKLFFIMACLGVCLWSCEEDDGPLEINDAFLEVMTEAATQIGSDGMTLKGKIIYIGETDVEKVGFSYWKQGNLSTRKTVEAEYNPSDSTFTADVMELKSFTTYTFEAYAEDGVSKEEGDVLSAKTLVAEGVVAPVVEMVGTDSLSFNSVVLRGKLVSDGQSDQTTFQLMYWEKGFDNKAESVEPAMDEETNIGSYKLMGLRPGKEYKFTVLALNEVGSAFSDTLAFTTNSMVFVDVDAGEGANDGSSWKDAFVSLKEAVEAGGIDAEFWIAEGLYNESEIPLYNGTRFLGGFTGTEEMESQRDPVAHVTAIGRTQEQYDAGKDDKFKILTSQFKHKLEGSEFDGIRFQYSKNDDYGGVLDCRLGSPIFRNCVFYKNRSSKKGGAVHLNKSAAQFHNCTFEENYAHWDGAGIAALGGDTKGVVINECIFLNNKTPWKAGAVLLEHGILIRESSFIGNWGNNGVIYVYKGSCPNFIGEIQNIDNKNKKGDGPVNRFVDNVAADCGLY